MNGISSIYEKNNIHPGNIFFTDESILNLSSYFNKNIKTQRLIKNWNEIALKKVTENFI